MARRFLVDPKEYNGREKSFRLLTHSFKIPKYEDGDSSKNILKYMTIRLDIYINRQSISVELNNQTSYFTKMETMIEHLTHDVIKESAIKLQPYQRSELMQIIKDIRVVTDAVIEAAKVNRDRIIDIIYKEVEDSCS